MNHFAANPRGQTIEKRTLASDLSGTGHASLCPCCWKDPMVKALSLDDLLDLDRLKKWRQQRADETANPYVLYLIKVLWPYERGLHRKYVLDRILDLRKAKGLSVPSNFESSVQNAFQTHSSESDMFEARAAPPEDDLFYWPIGKRTGKWAVRRDRAEAWLTRKGLPPI
jgi:hypothetical protein